METSDQLDKEIQRLYSLRRLALGSELLQKCTVRVAYTNKEIRLRFTYGPEPGHPDVLQTLHAEPNTDKEVVLKTAIKFLDEEFHRVLSNYFEKLAADIAVPMPEEPKQLYVEIDGQVECVECGALDGLHHDTCSSWRSGGEPEHNSEDEQLGEDAQEQHMGKVEDGVQLNTRDPE